MIKFEVTLRKIRGVSDKTKIKTQVKLNKKMGKCYSWEDYKLNMKEVSKIAKQQNPGYMVWYIKQL